MFTVPLHAVLKMTTMEPHEVLKERDELVEFQHSMGKAAFVSHQWVSVKHPDPDFRQMRVLQEAMHQILNKMQYIPLDSRAETAAPGAKPLNVKDLRTQPLFIWYDFFSCPQLEASGPGNRLLDAISSIPAYVEQSAFFFALCPTLQNLTGSEMLSFASWLQRGWCRMEKACRELSESSSWILIKSPLNIELKLVVTGHELGSVGEGSFSVDQDRERLAPVLLRAVKRKLLLQLKCRDLTGYRLLLNQQAVILRGLPMEELVHVIPGLDIDGSEQDSVPYAVADFFHQNGFTRVEESTSSGWLPLHYAALRGDPMLIHGLLQRRADPNGLTKKDSTRILLPRWSSPLTICTLFKHHEAANFLIKAGARTIDHSMLPPLHGATCAGDPEGIALLLAAGCSIYERNMFEVTAVEAAAMYGSVPSLKELATRAGDTIDLGHSLHMAMLHNGSAEVAQELLDMRANVNDQTFDWCKRNALVRFLCKLSQVQYHLGKSSQFALQVYHAEGATPLMFALLSSHYEGAAVLISAGAQLDLRNSRGWKAADFTRGHRVPPFLARALLETPEDSLELPIYNDSGGLEWLKQRELSAEVPRHDEDGDGYVEVAF